jgi:hypothetical protein
MMEIFMPHPVHTVNCRYSATVCSPQCLALYRGWRFSAILHCREFLYADFFWSLGKDGAISGVDRQLLRLQLYDGLGKSGRGNSRCWFDICLDRQRINTGIFCKDNDLTATIRNRDLSRTKQACRQLENDVRYSHENKNHNFVTSGETEL